MALDPRDIVTDLSKRAHRPDDEPPTMLSRPVPVDRPPTSVRQDPAVTAMHEAWAQVHAPGGAAGTGSGGKRSLRARADAVAGALLSNVSQHDRALVGSVIQAVDAVARRCDELGDRVHELEQLLGEVVEVLGADLTRIRAHLSAETADGLGASRQDG